MKIYTRVLANPFALPYEDPPAPTPPVVPAPPAEPPAGTFTQEQMDAAVAAGIAEQQQSNKVLVDELDSLRKKQSLTADERKRLEEANQELRQKNMSADEIAAEERQKLVTQNDEEKQLLINQRDSAVGRYNTAKIRREITDAAVANNALVPGQFVSILERDCTVTPIKDAAGNDTAGDEVRIKLMAPDKDGKPMEYDLTIAEAVKKMSEMDDHFNLFKGEDGGLGTRNVPGQNTAAMTDVDAAKSMTPTQYREYKRKQQGKS